MPNAEKTQTKVILTLGIHTVVESDLRYFCATKSEHFVVGQNRRRPKSAQKKNWYAKLIVLRFMVTRYIRNMNAFLHCHYAYLSITITGKLSALITTKYCITVIAMQRSPAVSVRSLVFFGSCENKLGHYKQSRDMRCITPGIVQCRLCENATLLAIKQLRKITFY